ncbi:hypothetical protein D3C72_995030 [compost metagenome]
MQRLNDFFRQQAVGFDGHEHVRGLNADLEVLEIQAFEVLNVTQSRFDQRSRGRLAVFLLQVFFQRAGVDADADRNAAITRCIDHRPNTVFTTDVARVDTQAVDAQFGHAQGDLVVEVDVGNQRHADLLLDAAERLGCVHVRHRDAHDVHAGIDQALDLRHGGGHIVGVGVGHALHRDGGITTHRHIADPDFAGFATFDRRFAVHDYCPNFRRAVSPLVNGATSTAWPL